MLRSALACFAAGGVAGTYAFMDDTRVALAETLFVLFFLAGMVLIFCRGGKFGGIRRVR